MTYVGRIGFTGHCLLPARENLLSTANNTSAYGSVIGCQEAIELLRRCLRWFLKFHPAYQQPWCSSSISTPSQPGGCPACVSKLKQLASQVRRIAVHLHSLHFCLSDALPSCCCSSYRALLYHVAFRLLAPPFDC